MPREPRVKSKTGIYHIIMRGINYQTIFEDEEDYDKFIQTLRRYKDISGYKLYAYCLMDNHLHLLLMEEKEALETVTRRIFGSYVLWYNKKYGRVGHLFQDRFKSEPVEDDAYFLTVLRYIFQNPIKAGIKAKVRDYSWTNYSDYLEGRNNTDTDFALNMLSTEMDKAIKRFTEYINTENNDECLEIEEKRTVTDNDARKMIKEHCKVDHVIDLQTVDIHKRNLLLKELKDSYGLSIRQLERVTGISRGIIQRL